MKETRRHNIGNQPHESDFKPYTAPFELRDGGTVNTFTRDPATDRKTSIISETFGISPEKWTIHSFSNETSSGKAVLAIDGNLYTWWETQSTYIPSGYGTPPEMLQNRKLSPLRLPHIFQAYICQLRPKPWNFLKCNIVA